MTPEEAAQTRAYVTAAFMRPEHMPPVEFWAGTLHDIPQQAAHESLDALMLRGDIWPPTPGQLRRAVFADNGLLPEPAPLAWERVVGVFSEDGAGRERLTALTARALKAFAGTEYRAWQAWRAGQSASVRKVFVETYEALRGEEIRRVLKEDFTEALSARMTDDFADSHGLESVWVDEGMGL